MIYEILNRPPCGDCAKPLVIEGLCPVRSVPGRSGFLPEFHIGLHGPCGRGQVFYLHS